MRTVPLLMALLLAACAGGDEGETTAEGPPATTATTTAPAGPCNLKPITFTSERWEGSAVTPPGEGGVVWEQVYTFANANDVSVRLSSMVVHLRLAGFEGYFLKLARTNFRPVPDEVIPPRQDQQRVAHVWLEPGNRPATEDLHVTATADVGGTQCQVPVDRLSSAPVPAHVLDLPSCEPLPTIPPC